MEILQFLFHNYGITHWGWAPLKTPLSLDIYKAWIAKGHHGDMQYLATHIPQKETPQRLLPKAQSALVFTWDYGLTANSLPTPHLKIASYAQDSDYHIWLQQKINSLSLDLKKLFPQEEFLGFTDSSPVLERDLAYQAGLGWIGKNSCLIDRKKGSLFFIAEIYTSLQFDQKLQKKPSPDHCGTCDRCITACPTQAIKEDRTLNATECISYWTIESKKVPPTHLREKFSDWFFGCDICQMVCPWNLKLRDFVDTKSENIEDDLRLILNSSNKQLLRLFADTPLTRAGGRGLKRNALITIANLKLLNLEEPVKTYVEDPQLGELARWTLEKLRR